MQPAQRRDPLHWSCVQLNHNRSFHRIGNGAAWTTTWTSSYTPCKSPRHHHPPNEIGPQPLASVSHSSQILNCWLTTICLLQNVAPQHWQFYLSFPSNFTPHRSWEHTAAPLIHLAMHDCVAQSSHVRRDRVTSGSGFIGSLLPGSLSDLNSPSLSILNSPSAPSSVLPMLLEDNRKSLKSHWQRVAVSSGPMKDKESGGECYQIANHVIREKRQMRRDWERVRAESLNQLTPQWPEIPKPSSPLVPARTCKLI